MTESENRGYKAVISDQTIDFELCQLKNEGWCPQLVVEVVTQTSDTTAAIGKLARYFGLEAISRGNEIAVSCRIGTGGAKECGHFKVTYLPKSDKLEENNT